MKKTIRLFCSTKEKAEQNLKKLSLGQLQAMIEDQSFVDVITFNSEKEYQNAKSSLTKRYNLTNAKQVLLVINHAQRTFKKELEVCDV